MALFVLLHVFTLSFLQMLRMQLRRLNKNVTKFMSRPAHIVGRRAVPQLNSTAVAVAEIQTTVDAREALEAAPMEPENGPQEPARPLIARLSKCPKTLNDLWAEYEFGIGGY